MDAASSTPCEARAAAVDRLLALVHASLRPPYSSMKCPSLHDNSSDADEQHMASQAMQKTLVVFMETASAFLYLSS